MVNLVVCFLFGAALVGQGSGYGKIYAFHLLLPIAVITLFFSKQFKSSNLKSLVPILLIFLYACLSLFWTPNLKDGINDLIPLFFGVGFLVVLINSNIDEQKLLKVIQIVVWVNIFICVGETLQLFRYPYSLFSHLAPTFGKVQSNWAPHSIDVPTGFHWNPNNNAFFLLLFSPLILNLGPVYRRLIYYFVTTYVVYMSASKLVLIGWILMSLTIPFCLAFKTRFKIVVAAIISTVFITFVLVASFEDNIRTRGYRMTISSVVNYLFIVPDNFSKRFSGHEVLFDYSQKDASLHDRMTFIDGLAIELKDHLLFGIGAGGLTQKSNTQGGITLSLATPHFYFLEFLTKYGLVILLLYFGWICRLAWQSFRVNKPLGLSLLLFIIFSPVISSASYFLPMWALFGFALISIRTSQPSQAQNKQF